MSASMLIRPRRPRRKTVLPPRTPTESRDLLDDAASEAAFQKLLIDCARYCGWLVQHNYDSRRSGPDAGVPDLLLVRSNRLIFAELKTPRGRLSHAQMTWLTALKFTSAEVYCWRPSDWDFIVKILA